MSPNGAKLYAANRKSNNLSVIDVARDEVSATIPVGTTPYALAFTPNSGKVYVANYSSNNVSVIDAVRDVESRRVAVGAGPTDIAIRPDGAKVYVPNSRFSLTLGSVSVIDTASDTVSKTITIGGFDATIVAWNPAGTKAYVGHVGSPYALGDISVVSAASEAVTRSFGVGNRPVAIAFTSDGMKAYVVNTRSDNVSVIDTATDTVSKTVRVSDEPVDIAIVPSAPQPTRADLAITKTVSPNPVASGEVITWRLTVSNNGGAEAQDVTVIDTLPAGVTFVSCIHPTGECQVSGGTVTARLGTLGGGANSVVTITARARVVTTQTTIVNSARVSTTSAELDTRNNEVSQTTTVNPSAQQSLAGRWEATFDWTLSQCPIPPGSCTRCITSHVYSVSQSGNTLQVSSLDTQPAQLNGTVTGASVNVTLRELFGGGCTRTFTLIGTAAAGRITGSVSGGDDNCGTCRIGGTFLINISRSL